MWRRGKIGNLMLMLDAGDVCQLVWRDDWITGVVACECQLGGRWGVGLVGQVARSKSSDSGVVVVVSETVFVNGAFVSSTTVAKALGNESGSV